MIGLIFGSIACFIYEAITDSGIKKVKEDVDKQIAYARRKYGRM